MEFREGWLQGAGLIAGLVLAISPAHAVDGVIEINQTSALAGGITVGDGAGYPISITSPGAYRLTGNLDVSNLVSYGILIASPDVTLDMNGFTLGTSSTSNTTGVFLSAGSNNVEVRGGTIRDFPSHGLFVTAGVSLVRVIDVRAIGNTGTGLLVQGEGSLVRGCTVANNGGIGIRGFAGSLLLENLVYGNASTGLVLNDVAYGSNVVFGNDGGTGVQVSANRGVQVTGNQCGTGACP